MDMRARLVQKLDDDNFVFLQEMRSVDPADQGATIKTAVLMSRFRVDSGYHIYVQNLDRQQIEMADSFTGDPVTLTREMWISNEQLVWIEFVDVGNGRNSITSRGILPTIGASLYYWMAEIVLLTLRCENAIFGPQFSLPAK